MPRLRAASKIASICAPSDFLFSSSFRTCSSTGSVLYLLCNCMPLAPDVWPLLKFVRSTICFSTLANWVCRVPSCFRKLAISAELAGIAARLLLEGLSFASPTCEIGLALTPKLSLVQTFLAFLGSAVAGAAACDGSFGGGDGGQACEDKAREG